MKQRFIYGGSFNPPGIHHQNIVSSLAKRCDELIVIPCGRRPDKASVNHIEPLHRATMADLAFGDIPNVKVELFDLENALFTPSIELDKMYSSVGWEVWHVVGTDQLIRGADGKSAIIREWVKGEELFKKCNFAVLARPGYEIDKKDMPPHSQLFAMRGNSNISSSQIRQSLFTHQNVSAFLSRRVEEFINRYGLYHRMNGGNIASLKIAHPKCKIVYNKTRRNDEDKKWLSILSGVSSQKDPDMIVVIGGDGTMLHAIRKYWRMRRPFFGINTGHRGYLLNDIKPSQGAIRLLSQELVLHQLPMLYVETNISSAARQSALAFNDAWVERATGQTARLEVSVDGKVRLKDFWCDTGLVATAQGSTAYASAMGTPPIPVGVPALVFAGSSVTRPLNWRPAYMPIHSAIKFRTLDPIGRPIRAYYDGIDAGIVSEMSVRASRIAGAEVAFMRDHSPAEKLSKIQFGE
jgi:NAD+ kinase